MSNKFKIYLTTLTLFLTIGIASARTPIVSNEIKSKVTCTKTHVMDGKATFYGTNYKTGRKTASGKTFDRNKFTAAHRTLPFGTKVLVTNTQNGKTVEVEITDRGPFGAGRVIDLSPVAFKELAPLSKGVVSVQLEIIPPQTS